MSVRLRAEFTGECQVCDGMGLILSWFRGPREPVDLLDVSVETQVSSHLNGWRLGEGV